MNTTATATSPPTPSTKSAFRRVGVPVLKGTVSLLLLAYVVSLFGVLDSSHVLDTINWPLLGVAFVLQTGIIVFEALRLWWLSRSAATTPLSLGKIARITLASLAIGLVTPGLIGVEGYKLYQLGRHMPWAASVSLVFVARLVALVMILASFTVGTLWLGQSLSVQLTNWLAIVAISSVLVLALFSVGYRRRWLPTMVSTLVEKGITFVQQGWNALAALSAGQLVVLTATSFLVEACRVLSLGFFVQSLSASLPLPVLMVASALSTAVCFLPISLNGIGVREVSLTMVFAAYGVSMAQAGLVSILSRVTLLVWVLPGLVFFFTMRRQQQSGLNNSVIESQ